MILSAIHKRIDFAKPDKKIILTENFINPGILKRNLVLKYGMVTNLHVNSFRNFIRDISAQYFKEQKCLSGDMQFWTVFKLINDLKSQLEYFNGVVQFMGFCRGVVELLEKLELNNISKKELKLLGKKSENIKKWDELILIRKTYEEYKDKHKLFDYSDTVHKLLQERIKFNNTYIIDFNKSLSEDKLISESGIQRISNEIKAYKYELSGYRVDTPNQEIMQTIRNIRNDFQSLSSPVKIGICVPDYDKAYYQFNAALVNINQPELIHFSKGIPFFQTSIGKLFCYVTDWIADSCSINILIKLFESGHFNYKCTGDYDYKTFINAITYFRKSEIVLFDNKFIKAFENYLAGKIIKEDEDSESLVPSEVKLASELTEMFNGIISGNSLRNQILTLNNIIDKISYTTNQNERSALIRIQNIFEDLINSEFLENSSLSLTDFLITIKEQLENAYVGVKLPDYTKPVVGTIKDLVYYEFDKLYILGLNEKGIPRKLFQNPLLLDYEIDIIKSINTKAQYSKLINRQEENDARFENLKSAVKSKLVVSAPLKDLASGREFLVSRYLLSEWERYFKVKKKYKGIDYKIVSKDLAENSSSENNYTCSNPADSFYHFEMAVSIGISNDHKKLVRYELNNYFPGVKNILDYKLNFKTSSTFDYYWGFLDLDENRQLPVFSASRITTWANCPYQYFLKYELNLKKKEEYDKTDLSWLDILSYGSFLHELYFNFFIQLREQKGIDFNSINKSDEKVLLKEFDKLIEVYKQNYPVKSEIHFLNQYKKLKQDAAQFFENELNNKNVRKYFELAFGMPDKVGRDPLKCLDHPAELKLDDGSILLFRGSIDRVDINSGNYVLIDYKSGKPRENTSSAPYDGGKFIQAGIYPLIAVQIDKKITDPLFQYYYTNSERGFARLEFNGDNLPHFKSLLTSIIIQIRKGNFVPILQDGSYGMCQYCDFRNECEKGRIKTAKMRSTDDPNYSNYKSITKEKLDEIL